MGKIKHFTDLSIWCKSHQLTILVYQVTKMFPKDERFALTDQLRRAVVSIESNIAEGFSRFGKREKRQYYAIAKGSLTEVECQLMIARDVGYLSNKKYEALQIVVVEIGKMFTGILKRMESW